MGSTPVSPGKSAAPSTKVSRGVTVKGSLRTWAPSLSAGADSGADCRSAAAVSVAVSVVRVSVDSLFSHGQSFASVTTGR